MDKTTKSRKANTLKNKMLDMKIGETIQFPTYNVSSIRVTASNVGIEFQRKYVTRCSPDNKNINVTRLI